MVKTFKDYGTLRVKLDEERALHNGFGAREFNVFYKLHKQFKLLFPRTVVGLLMNVSSRTIYDWFKQWEREETV